MAGPELGPLVDQLVALHPPGNEAAEPDALLADAARTNEAWLRVLLSHLVMPDAEHVDEPTLTLLVRIAAYRDRWHISGPAPLGHGSTTEDQALDSAALLHAVHAATGRDGKSTQRIEVADREPSQGLGI
jgi:hypothetical protein